MNSIIGFSILFLLPTGSLSYGIFDGFHSYYPLKNYQDDQYSKWPSFNQNPNECFKVYWNVPSQVCGSQMGVNLNLQNFGVRVNKDQNFFGDEINIFYEGDVLLWPHIDANGQKINGGIPQLGNLNDHLKAFEIQISKKIPNPAFSGPAVIDFEYYTPLWSSLWGHQKIYKNLSLEYARSYLGMLNEASDNPDLLRYAENSFEAATRIFMEQTINHGRSLRPFAKWGYYEFPTCSKTQFHLEGCPYSEQVNNEKLMWLYTASDALYPSVYLYKAAFKHHSHYVPWILKMYRETSRITQMVNSDRRRNMKSLLEVYPYFRFEYADTSPSTELLSDLDSRASILGAKLFSFNGLIIWGSSNGMNKKCAILRNFFDQYLGPLIYYASRCSL